MFIFLFNGFIMCKLIRAAFGVLLQAMFMYDWKQLTQRLKLQEKLVTIMSFGEPFTKTTISIHEDKY